MAMKIRLARGGSRKRPHYAIVASDSRMPRDGRFKEKLGTYNPLLPKDSEDRVKMNMDRVRFWLDQGAQPTDRVSRFLEAAGEKEKTERSNPDKAKPGKKARERAEEKATKAAAVDAAVDGAAEAGAAEAASAESDGADSDPGAPEEAVVEPAEEAPATGTEEEAPAEAAGDGEEDAG